MRQPRIKIPPDQAAAVYHCISRTVNGERLLDSVAKEVLRKQLWQIAEYCGVTVITYAILSNHFHVLLHVPESGKVSDEELLRRYQVLYPKPTEYQTAELSVIRAQLETNGPEACAWRQRQLALMGDLSQFMKLLKQRFTRWFNKSHQRFGTLWSERFKSILIEPTGHVVRTMAAYIDLNCVRAGLANDPKDYRFCGYAEAVAGNRAAQHGLRFATACADWSESQAGYRQILFGTGADPRETGHTISTEDFKRIMAEGGILPLTTVLRCRIRYFSDGAVLGTMAFVNSQIAVYCERTRRKQQPTSRRLPPVTAWGDLVSMRALRNGVL